MAKSSWALGHTAPDQAGPLAPRRGAAGVKFVRERQEDFAISLAMSPRVRPQADEEKPVDER